MIGYCSNQLAILSRGVSSGHVDGYGWYSTVFEVVVSGRTAMQEGMDGRRTGMLSSNTMESECWVS